MSTRKKPLGSLLTIDQAAKLTKVPGRTLRYACHKGLVPSVRVGEKSYLIERNDALFFAKHRPKRGVKPKS